MVQPHTLERKVFTTKRALEFFSEPGLTRQMGYGRGLWPVVIAKEWIDNALDACESGDIAPEITVTLGPDVLSVQDNGPGLPANVIEGSLDYNISVSDKKYYVSPTRGQLGNALKCVWAAPFVVSGNEFGSAEVIACGVHHRIEVKLDRIAQEPTIYRGTVPLVQNGTLIRLAWPGITCLTTSIPSRDLYNKPIADVLRALIADFAAFNPHASFRLHLPDQDLSLAASNAAWRKWKPNQPTSAHWYTPERLRDLVAAYLKDEQNGGDPRTVREFVSDFDGLRRSQYQKQVLEQAGLSGHGLNALAEDGDIPLAPIAKLLEAMKEHSRPVEPARLGVIGKDHLLAALKAQGVTEATFGYKKCCAVGDDGLPFVVEVAFGVKSERERQLLFGLNHSPVLKVPDEFVSDLLSKSRVQEFDPVVLLIHLSCPLLRFTDHGKSALAGTSEQIQNALADSITKITKDFAREKRRAAARESDELSESQIQKLNEDIQRDEIKQAAYAVMEQAYNAASANGTLPANARQIMYAARPLVLARIGKCWDDSAYFTQTLLPDYVEENPAQTEDWDIVYDARGHLTEPHVKERFGIGTLNVREYISGWNGQNSRELNVAVNELYPTRGPENRYQFALFIEKEGFDPLLARSQIAERFDIAIFSSKGMSTTATRELVDNLSQQGVTILIVHDFDIDGLGIAHNLANDTRRYRFQSKPDVVDFGLRLDDVEALSLQSETWERRKLKKDPCERLLRYGASFEECQYLVREEDISCEGKGYRGERVELNAMTSAQFVAWLEAKLVENGVEKVVPDREVLAKAYHRARDIRRLKEKLEAIKQEPDDSPIPKKLEQRVRKILAKDPRLSWDQALLYIVAERDGDIFARS